MLKEEDLENSNKEEDPESNGSRGYLIKYWMVMV